MMQFSFWIRSICAVAGMLLLAQCSSGVERRIQANPQLFAALSAEDKALVQARQVREGMSKDAVFLALGRPGRVYQGRQGGKPFERWTYVGQRSVVTQNYGGWGGWGGPRGAFCGPFYDPFFAAGPSVTYIPYDAAVVEFSQGRVVGFESAAR